MRYFLYAIFLLGAQKLSAQCFSKPLGLFHYCVDLNGDVDSISISPEYLIDVSSSEVSWSIVGATNESASEYLDDVNSTSPLFKTNNNSLEGEIIKLEVEVIDNNQLVCKDSIGVRIYSYGMILADDVEYIIEGDSIQLDNYIDWGIGPRRYVWTPNIDISDTSSSAPWVHPNQNIIYTLEIDDSVGCTMNQNIRLIVNPLGLGEPSEFKINVYPNPVAEESSLILPKGSTLFIYNSTGSVIKEVITDGTYIIENGEFDTGNYHFKVFAEFRSYSGSFFVK